MRNDNNFVKIEAIHGPRLVRPADVESAYQVKDSGHVMVVLRSGRLFQCAPSVTVEEVMTALNSDTGWGAGDKP